MSRLFQQNLEFFQKRFPHVAAVINSNAKIPDVQIETVQSRTGLPVVRVTKDGRRVYLNSSYDPETEARRWAANFASPKQGCALLCGGSFFYYLKALLEQDCFTKIAVFEPDPQIFKACMEQIDLQPLFKSNKLQLVVGTDYNANAIISLEFLGEQLIDAKDGMELIIAPPYGELYRNELGLFQDKFKELIQINQTNITTLNLFLRDWLKNVLKVFKYAADSPVIRNFFGQFKDVPAVIISSGPSLEKNIQLVPELMDKAVVFCGGSSIRATRHFGVKPHFLVGIDGGEVNRAIFGDQDLSGIDLIYCTRFYNEVVAKFPGRKILMQIDTEHLPQYLIEQNGGYKIGEVSSGFSVAHVCLDLAFKFGCNPIILIGQDLAYSSGKRYADGQLFQIYLNPKCLPRNFFITKDIYGNDIVTNKEFDRFRIIFERMIETSYRNKVTIINASEGLPIKGTINRKFAEAIAEYFHEDRRVKERITELYEKGMAEIRSHRIDVPGYCRKLNEMMCHANSQLEELIERLQVIRRLNYESEQFEPGRLESELARITSGYDLVLNRPEYHAFLKELQAGILVIYKAQLNNFQTVGTKSEYDQKLQIYLNIILETQKYLEFIIECLQENFTEEHPSQTITQVDRSFLEDFERRIKQGEDLPRLRKTLEAGLKESAPDSRGAYLYLLGFLFFKQGLKEQALPLLEQSVQVDSGLARAHFRLAKLYLAKRDFIKAGKPLETCLSTDYRKSYCWRRLIENHFLTKNYIAVYNLLEEYAKEYGWNQAALALKMELLTRMDLAVEAVKIYERLSSKYKPSRRLKIFLQHSKDQRPGTVYEENYRANCELFNRKGIAMPDYAEVRFKVIRLLAGELVYDCTSGVFFSGVNQAPKCNIPVSGTDVLVVYNTDNTRIFERLVEILDDRNVAQWKQIGMIPVLVIERDLEKWCVIAQLFDLRRLEEWANLQYYIVPSDAELEKVFLAENLPLPNLLYGTNPAEFEQFLTKMKFAKSKVYQEQLVDLQGYYQDYQPSKPGKVLVITSRLNEVFLHYGTMLHQYFQGVGITSILHTEPAPYQRFTPEDDAKIMDEFRPDLVINLLGIQEEFIVYRNLNIPYISWLLTDRQIPEELKSSCPRQKIVYTGNLTVVKQLIQREFSKDKLLPVPLPVSENGILPAVEEKASEGIGIIGDLGVLEETLTNLKTIIHGLAVTNAWKLTQQEINDILKSIYFWVRSQHDADDLAGSSLEEYQEFLRESFGRYNLLLGAQELQLLPGLIKQEFEDYSFKRLQADWVINEYKNVPIRIYGNGWDQDPLFKPFWKGPLNPLIDLERFQNEIMHNKINLILGPAINNKSYQQPALIYGLVSGGFLITNDLLVKEYGTQALAHFNGKLEVYGSKKEMKDQITYFLSHDQERLNRAQELQLFITNNFKVDKIVDMML